MHLSKSSANIALVHLELTFRSSHPGVFYKKGVLKNFAKFTGKHQCQSLFFNKKETLAQVFSCEYCEIFKNTFYAEHLRVTASVR